jgi:hypothetical protein
LGERRLTKRLGREAVSLLDNDAFKDALSTESRENLAKHDSIRTAAGGATLSALGTAARQASAGNLLSLLEAHVCKEHGDIMTDFVAAEWLQEMARLSPTDLAAKKNSLCMLGRDPFVEYMNKVNGKKPEKQPGQRGGVSKDQVTFGLILSVPATKHSCQDAKTATLARILSHIFWRNTMKRKDDARRPNKLLASNQAAAASGDV